MPRRLHERYAPGERVEMRFGEAAEWQPAVVLRGEPPGLWVRTADGREWFVTNTYRIRPAEQRPSPDEGQAEE